MPSTREIVRSWIELRERGLPRSVLTHGGLLVHNGLAAASVGMRHPALSAMVATSPRVEGGIAPPWGGRTTGAAEAAGILAGAISIDAFDDYDVATLIHPTTSVLGAALPLAASLGLDGRRTLSAFALGCEAALRVGDALQPGHYARGWHVTATTGYVGAAVASGLLLGLGEDALVGCLSVAVAQVGGTRALLTAEARALNPARAAATGVRAALTAAAGPGPARGAATDPLAGLIASFGSEPDRKAAAAHRALGQTWRVLDVHGKAFPCGLLCFPAVRAALRAASALRAGEHATTVSVRVSPNTAEVTDRPHPLDASTAALSTQHAVACSLLFGRLGLEHYTEALVGAGPVAAMRKAVRVVSDRGLLDDRARITVSTSTGRTLRFEGLPAAPPQSLEHRRNLRDKAAACLRSVGADPAAIARATDEFEHGGSASALLAACGRPDVTA